MAIIEQNNRAHDICSSVLMSHLCDFVEQQTLTDDAGDRLRPDLQVRLPNQRTIVIDAKVPLSAYLDAIECADEQERTARLQAHARQVREHIGVMVRRGLMPSRSKTRGRRSTKG